jgi:hypothetical protein
MDFYQASHPENSTNKGRVYLKQNHYNFEKIEASWTGASHKSAKRSIFRRKNVLLL